MFSNWNHNKFIYIKNFLKQKDFLNIKKDLIDNFSTFLNVEQNCKLKSGKQTTSDLYEIFTGNYYPNNKHWKNYFNKLDEIMTNLGKNKLYKCWSLKINKKQNGFFHQHNENLITSVFYVQNKNYELGTQLRDKDNDIIIPGYENSILIFEGNILHDAVFPNYKLEQPRYTLITDYE